MAAMNMQMFARMFLVHELTESGMALGVMALANACPCSSYPSLGESLRIASKRNTFS